MITPLAPLPEKKTAPVIRYQDSDHRYWIDGIEVPSVSALLEETTPKPALTWWGMRVGIAACIKLLQENHVSWPVLAEHVYEEVLTGIPINSPKVMRGKGKNRKEKILVEAETINKKLDTNNIKSDAGDRGTAVHAAVELIGTHDTIPDINEFPVEQQGYIRAVARWWMEQQPEFLRQEVIVGSRRHAFAGRFDLDANYPAPTAEGKSRILTDFKTSKSVYESHFEQLRLYELAEYELNEFIIEVDERVTFDRLAVVLLKPDGNYEVHYADHVSRETALAVANLAHQRRADAARLKAGESAQAQLPIGV